MAKMRRQVGREGEIHFIFTNKETETLAFLLQHVETPSREADEVVNRFHCFLMYGLESAPGAQIQEDLEV